VIATSSRAPFPDEKQLRRWGAWILVGLSLLLLLPGNNLIPLIDRDEPRFAEATREMIVRHEWVIPYFNGEHRFDKPILIYWMMRGAYAFFGVNEFAARLPSVLCAALLVWLTFQVGARWLSAAVGFAAGFGLLTCVQMLMHGRSAVADMPMVVCVFAAHWSLFELLSASSSEGLWKWWTLFWTACGVGFLAKGPVAIVLPALTLLFYRFVFWRKPVPWRRLRAEWGVPLFLLMVGSWGIPALVLTHGDFFRVGIEKHVLQRGFTSFEGHGAFAPYYYLLTAFLSLFPWIAFAGDTVVTVRRDWNAQNAFLLSWVVGTYLLFTCYLTKLPHYVLPAFPALFLMFGQAIQATPTPSRVSKAWFWLVIVIGLIVTTALFAARWELYRFPQLSGLGTAAAAATGMVLSLTLLAVCWRKRYSFASMIYLLTLVLCIVVLGEGLRSVSPAVAVRGLAETLPPTTRCASWRFAEPSLVFYTARYWDSLGSAREVKEFLNQPGPRLVVCQISETRLAQFFRRTTLTRRLNSAASDVLASISDAGIPSVQINGLNLAHASWVDLQVYYRR